LRWRSIYQEMLNPGAKTFQRIEENYTDGINEGFNNVEMLDVFEKSRKG